MTSLLRRFWSETNAAVAFETVIVFPFLVWAWVGTFIFFDAYRVYNTSIKATYTVADLLSRQTCTVYEADIEGMSAMLAAMIRDTDRVEMRATQILRTSGGDYLVDWSEATGTLADYATPSLAAIEDRLPDMAEGERIVLVESFIDYEPAFDIGLNNLTFDNFTVTRPRYAGQVPYSDDPDEPSRCE